MYADCGRVRCGGKQCSFVEYRGYKVIYRRYASLFFIVGVKDDDSEVTCVAFARRMGDVMYRAGGTESNLDVLLLSLVKRRVKNELGILEFIHALVETMDKYFESVVCSCLHLSASQLADCIGRCELPGAAR